MRQSQLFTKTQKNSPKDELCQSSIFLIRGGYINKLMAGVYTFLPLGFLVLKKIERIIRREMLDIDAQEILMPTLTPRELWEQTKRWATFTDLYKFKDLNNKELALAATHEEVITPLVKTYVSSYKDLPFSAFQIQNKFRSELRVKSGLIRGKEFLMKDLYSFHENDEDLENYYQKVTDAYFKIFNQTDIGTKTFFTYASGGAFSKYSHEFQTISTAGEDNIFLCKKCKIAINREIINEQKVCPNCNTDNFQQEKSIEVGNIFKLGTRFSQPFNLTFHDKLGKEKLITMASYGIGLSRLLATIVEVNHDKKGIIWPKNVTPFQVHLIDLENNEISEKFYHVLQKNNLTVLFDDRKANIGEKLNDADLLGCAVRLISSKKNTAKIEIKYRNEESSKINDLNSVINELINYYNI